MEFEQEPNYEYLRGLFRSVMSKNNYSFDFQYDWTKPAKKEEQTIINTKSLKNFQNQNINGNLINKNINLNTISNYNNSNTIQNTNSIGKLNLNINNDVNNLNSIMNNVSTTKNSNQNFLSKSNTKIPKAATIETNAKLTGYNYNYNYSINNLNAQRASLNNINPSKVNFMDIAPKTNKHEAFPSL